MKGPSAGLLAMLEALRTTEGNIRSLGPAGALGDVYMPYRIWLKVVQDAIAAGKAELDPR